MSTGTTNDPTAEVSAQITDGSGNTNVFTGEVERDGRFWVDNLPLGSGTNELTVTITDAGGTVNVTNLTVVQSTVGVTMNSLSESQLWQGSVVVHGTVSDASYVVWVNGVQAANNGGGNWGATNVPMAAGGVAVFNVTAYPAAEAPDPATAVPFVNPQTPDAVNSNSVPVKPDTIGIVLASDTQTEASSSYDNDELDDDEGVYGIDMTSHSGNFHQEWDRTNGAWCTESGTSVGYHYERGWSEDPPETNSCGSSYTWAPSSSSPYSDTAVGAPTNVDCDEICDLVNEHCAVSQDTASSWTSDDGLEQREDTSHYERKAQTKFLLVSGGRGIPGRQILHDISASANSVLPYMDIRSTTHHERDWFDQLDNFPESRVPSQSISVGSVGKLYPDGHFWKVTPAGAGAMNVTPTVDKNKFYTFDVYDSTRALWIRANDIGLRPDMVVNDANHAIGEKINLAPQFVPDLPDNTEIDSILWAPQGKFINAFKVWIEGIGLNNDEDDYDYAEGLTDFTIDASRLAQWNTFAWWQTGSTTGFEQKKITVAINLVVPNGQRFTMIAKGLIGMHQPTATWYAPAYSAGIIHGYLNIIGLPEVGVGDWFDGITGATNTLGLQARSSSLVQGHFDMTQLIVRNSTVESWTDWRLDNSFPYGPPPRTSDSYDQQPDGSFRSQYSFTDSPNVIGVFNANCTDTFKQFFMFRPLTGGSIWVTLGVANWNWHGNVKPNLSDTDWIWNDSPTFYHSQSIESSSDFPEWINQKSNP